MSFNLNLLSCPKCGGKLKEAGEGRYICSFCERVWEKEIDDTFEKVMSGATAALSAERAADIARLKRALYEETHKEFISSEAVERICTDILNHYDDGDFYARFYLAASEKSKTAFHRFASELDIDEHIDDIPELLDYLIAGLREEWILDVSQIIEKAFKSRDTSLYSEYRSKFERMADNVNNGIYEPTLHRDVFVMYSGKDMDKVLKMVSMLENDYCLSCFVAARNLKHGAGSQDRYKDAIHTAIKNSDVFLLISSANSRTRQCEVYEEIIYIMDNFPYNPRVEYLAEDYLGYGIEKKFREFFEGLEYCTSYEDTAERILRYCDNIDKYKSEAARGNRTAAAEPIPEFYDLEGKLKEADGLYYGKNGFKQDLERAFLIYKEACERGSAEAQYKLAECYLKGYGTKKDTLKAMSNYKSAAEKGHSWAQYCTAYHYYAGDIVAQDYEESAMWHRKAAEQGNPWSQNELGKCYSQGRGVNQDHTEAALWFKRGAEQGDNSAQYNYANCFWQGLGVKKDTESAFMWFEKAAVQEHTWAQYFTAYCYQTGTGVGKDLEKAAEWHGRAARLGNPWSQNEYGKCCLYGRGRKKDEEEALEWFRRSSEQGDASAQYNLGFCYENGYGTRVNVYEAARWYKKAADQGSKQASAALDQLSSKNPNLLGNL